MNSRREKKRVTTLIRLVKAVRMFFSRGDSESATKTREVLDGVASPAHFHPQTPPRFVYTTASARRPNALVSALTFQSHVSGQLSLRTDELRPLSACLCVSVSQSGGGQVLPVAYHQSSVTRGTILFVNNSHLDIIRRIYCYWL